MLCIIWVFDVGDLRGKQGSCRKYIEFGVFPVPHWTACPFLPFPLTLTLSSSPLSFFPWLHNSHPSIHVSVSFHLWWSSHLPINPLPLHTPTCYLPGFVLSPVLYQLSPPPLPWTKTSPIYVLWRCCQTRWVTWALCIFWSIFCWSGQKYFNYPEDQ